MPIRRIPATGPPGATAVGTARTWPGRSMRLATTGSVSSGWPLTSRSSTCGCSAPVAAGPRTSSPASPGPRAARCPECRTIRPRVASSICHSVAVEGAGPPAKRPSVTRAPAARWWWSRRATATPMHRASRRRTARAWSRSPRRRARVRGHPSPTTGPPWRSRLRARGSGRRSIRARKVRAPPPTRATAERAWRRRTSPESSRSCCRAIRR